MAGKNQVEDDLEEIFGKLRDLKVGKVKRKSCGIGCKRNQTKVETEEKTETSRLDTLLHRTKRIERKSILKESKLKLPTNLVSLTNKKQKIKKKKTDETEPTNDLKATLKSSGAKNIHRSCSMEFRNASSSSLADYSLICSQNDLYDNESEELADYFEQVLFLPKPMSAMAEMMYG